MALKIPAQTPLTLTQSELTSKIITMKGSLISPFKKNKFISKEKQISSYDYLKKIITSLGLDLKFVLSLFIDELLGDGSEFLFQKIIESTAERLYVDGKQLPNINFNPSTKTEKEKKIIINSNISYIKSELQSAGISNFSQTVKQQIAKDITLLIFGNSNENAANILNPNAAERDRLIETSICSSNAFTLSNDIIITNQDVEYNRINLRNQLSQGRIKFEISCQDVYVSIPENPIIFFTQGGNTTIEGSVVSPSKSMELLANYVSSTVQEINNEKNSESAGKNFFEILIEKIISNINNLVFPHVSSFVDILQATPIGVDYTPHNLITNTCEFINDNNGDSQDNKKKFGEHLTNELYKKLISFLFIISIREFKKLIKNYFLLTVREKAKKRQEKLRKKYLKNIDDITENLDKIKKYQNALNDLKGFVDLNELKNIV